MARHPLEAELESGTDTRAGAGISALASPPLNAVRIEKGLREPRKKQNGFPRLQLDRALAVFPCIHFFAPLTKLGVLCLSDWLCLE